MDILPPPYYNCFDQENTEFLNYADRTPLLRVQAGFNVKDIPSYDYKSIQAKINDDLENPSLKDIAFLGRSNVGKSSLINSVTGL
jgi:ribosome biogenesis GTPase A